MDFVSKITFLENKLTTDAFVKHILFELSTDEENEIEPEEEHKFLLSLPVELNKFFSECIHILNNNDEEITNFPSSTVYYLICMIYVALCKTDDTVAESESIPVQAMILFLTLNSKNYIGCLNLESTVFNPVFQKILDVYAERAESQKEISPSLMSVWNNFLLTYNNKFDMYTVIHVFHMYLEHNTNTTVLSFELDNQAQRTTFKAIFTCFKTMLSREYTFQDTSDTVIALSLTLVNTTSNNTLSQSILYFFDSVIHKFCDEEWYLSFLIMMLKDVRNKKLYVKIINKLPMERHKDVVNVILNKYVSATDNSEVEMYLIVMKYLIDVPYQDIPDERRQKLVQRVITETYYRCSYNSNTVKEAVMSLFIDWCQMKDISVRRHIQLMFHSGSKVSAARLFEILQQSTDISWKNSSINLAFITLTCRLFMLNSSFMTHYRMRVLEVLCYKATGHCLKPCVPVIIELIKHYALSPHPILKMMIQLIINNSLNATSAAYYYIKEFYDLFANCMVETNDSEVEFSICNVIMTDDYNCLELFKMIQTHNLIRPEHIKALLQEKILKYPSSWKLLSILLDNIEYTNFPQYMDHYFKKCETPSFYLCPESLYMLQAMSKVFMAKIKNNLINGQDVKLARNVEEYLMVHLENLDVPAKHVEEVIILLLTVNKITHSSLNWIYSFFLEVFEKILTSVTCYTRMPLVRSIMYLEKMLMLLDLNVDEFVVNKLMYIMDIDRQPFIPYEEVHAAMVTLFAKVCLKFTDRITPSIPMFQHAMIHGTPPVQVMALSSLYDIANLHLHYYDPLYQGLFILIQSPNIEVKNMAVKMLVKLVNEDHLRLNCSDFIVLILILVDRNYKLCLYYVDLLQSDFIHRNQHTISKYFINLMFFLNNYKDNPTYPAALPDCSTPQDFTYERRIVIYKCLFWNLERSNQLQILAALNYEFLNSFYSGRISGTPNMLNILRDVLCLICFNTSHYINNNDTNDIAEFYRILFEDMKKDFFTRKGGDAESIHMEFDKIIEKILLSLLKILYKIEKSNADMLPQCFNTVCFVTRAHYTKVINMVQNNSKLQELYYELETCYVKYKEVISKEPLDILSHCDKVEWRLYLGCSELQLT